MSKLIAKSFVVGLLATAVFVPVAHAIESNPDAKNTSQKTEAAAKAQQRRDEAKKRICQVHERNIDRKTANLVAQAERQLTTFDKIADRVKEFKTNKNLTVADYDTLVANIAAKRAAAAAAIATLKADSASFNCDNDNAKATIQAFKNDLKAVRAALKEYRTAVRSLLVAVKTANGVKTEATQ